MQIGSAAAMRLTLLTGVILLAAAPSRAIPFTMEVLQNGTSVATLNETALGCASTGTDTAHCTGSNIPAGSELVITSLDMNIADPSINGTVAIENNTNFDQTITVIFSLPVGAIGPSTVTGGSVAGGVTDNDGNTATLSTTGPGSALYTALIDGAVWQTLFPHLTTVSASGYLSNDLPSGAAFGTPIPSLPGPAVVNKIGIQYDFNLTAHDAASFTGVFVVSPVPEPSTAVLTGLGLLGLATAARRR